MLVLLIIEILLLVAPCVVKGSSSKKPVCKWLSYLLDWRYSNLYCWRICLFISLSLLIVFISFSKSSNEELYFSWMIPSCVNLSILMILLTLTQTTSSLQKSSFFLHPSVLFLLSTFNLILFIFGVTIVNSFNWAALAIVIYQGIESVSFLIICVCLLITWHMGRPFHKPFHSSSIIETSTSHPYTIDFISPELLSKNLPTPSSSSPITLGMSYLPGRCRSNYQRSLPDDIERIQSHYHIDMIISLLPSYQLEEMKVSNLEETFIEHNLKYLIYGWRDKWIPSEVSIREIINVIETIVQNLREGRHILVHCFGGKGRTGVVIVGVLVRLGISLPVAIDLIRTSRRGCIHNPLQLFYLNWINNYYLTQRRQLEEER